MSRGLRMSIDEYRAKIKKKPHVDSKPMYALGRMKTGKMNKTEAAYAQHLELLKHAGEVVWYRFEGIKLRLADETFYTPDFAVLAKGGALEMHECKGWMMEDANVKIKVAAAMYPFKFYVVRAGKGGQWSVRWV